MQRKMIMGCVCLIAILLSINLIVQPSRLGECKKEKYSREIKDNDDGCKCPDSLEDLLAILNITSFNSLLEYISTFEAFESISNELFEQLIILEPRILDLISYSIELGYIKCIGKFLYDDSVFLGIRSTVDEKSIITS